MFSVVKNVMSFPAPQNFGQLTKASAKIWTAKSVPIFAANPIFESQNRMSYLTKKLSSFFCFLICILWLSGCTTPAPILQIDDQPSKTEGVMLLMEHSEFDNIVFQFHQIDGSQKTYSSPVFSAGAHFSALKLPVGTYEFHKITIGRIDYDFHKRALIKVESGKLNYWGDVFVSRATNNGYILAGYFEFGMVDKQENMEAYLQERFPDLLKRYTVVSNVPKLQEEK